jgi:hypothetical protein
MSALEGIADELAEAVHVADVPEADAWDIRRRAPNARWQRADAPQ